MEQEIGSLVGLIYWGAIIFFFVKGKMKWVAFLSLITLSNYPFIIGMICAYALPKKLIHGSVLPGLPMSISLALIVLAIYSIKSPKLPPVVSNKTSIKIRCLYLFLALATYFIGICVTLLYFYSPQTFGYTTTMPQYGVAAYLTMSLASSIFLYLASKEGTAKLPNLFRIISTLIILIFSTQVTLVISLILLYAYPIVPSTTYPTLAGMNMLSYLFSGVLLVLMRREYVSVDSTRTNPEG